MRVPYEYFNPMTQGLSQKETGARLANDPKGTVNRVVYCIWLNTAVQMHNLQVNGYCLCRAECITFPRSGWSRMYNITP